MIMNNLRSLTLARDSLMNNITEQMLQSDLISAARTSGLSAVAQV